MNTNYAGFWIRFVAWFIDGFVLGFIQWVIITPILATVGIVGSFSWSDFRNIDGFETLVPILAALIGMAFLINEVIKVLYHSFMESSNLQGSLGKMALGIIVTDLEGQRLGFGKALVRNLCKILSNMTMSIGYIIAGFTDKQQALHDIIAGTLVVKKQSPITQTSTITT